MQIATSNPQVIHLSPSGESTTIVPKITNSTTQQELPKNSTSKPLQGFQNPEQRVNINRNGAPKKGFRLKDFLLEELKAEVALKNKLGQTVGKAEKGKLLMRNLVRLGLEKDNMYAISEVLDRIDGKVETKSEIYGKDGAPLMPVPILGGAHVPTDNSNT